MTGNQTASKTVVAVAMGVVASAAAVALYQHAGLPGPVAATAALSAYLLLLTLHAFLWRGNRRELSPARPVDRREQELRRLNEKARAAQPPQMPAAARAPLPPAPPQQRPAGFGPAAPYKPESAPLLPPAPTGRQAERAAPPPPPVPPVARDGDHLEDFWSFRPAAAAEKTDTNKLPPFVSGRAARPAEPTLPGMPAARPPVAAANRPAAAQAQAPAQAPAQGPAPREADVEVIQDAIKRLLEEVNAAERQEAHPTAAGATPPPLPHLATGAREAEGPVDRSIDALRMAAGTMRSAIGASHHDADPFAAAPPPAPRATAPAAQPPPLPPFVRQAARPASPADNRARQMADAISAGRIDVALEPILGLEDQQTRHYEVTVRLRDADGKPLEVTADGPDLRGTGLLPLFDGVRVTRTAAVARRLEERGKIGSVFSAFSGESVADEHFLGELAETLHQRSSLAAQLVLSFTQSDVRGFSTPEWDSLADMRALGFRFALSHITDLDMDFEALAEQGFAFVKLDASVFLEGLPAPSGRLPSSDVCRHLARHGLTLVVEHIDDDEKLARVFGFGVLLGQGQLFGGARPVRADVVASRARTAAA
jgi:cyclic-di-GMP phosphodiesterase TipF (flagellum assembly factor)